MTEQYIKENLWVKESFRYESKEYKYFKNENIPKINLDNITSTNKLLDFLNFWKLYKPYPFQIYICMLIILMKMEKI